MRNSCGRKEEREGGGREEGRQEGRQEGRNKGKNSGNMESTESGNRLWGEGPGINRQLPIYLTGFFH